MIALDTNVLMEILEEGPRQPAVIAAITRHRGEKSKTAGLSTLTVSQLFYLAEQRQIPPLRVEALLAAYRLFAVNPLDIAWALARYRQTDFEAALQIAVAVREGCTSFLTLDKALTVKYHAHLPIELISS